MSKASLYSIVFLFWINSSLAQTKASLLLIPVTEENGLSDNHLNCVLKDKQGIVWIGTEDGLNLLDGSVIKSFKHKDDDTTSISGNNIHSIKEDAKANIWIGTENGLSCYHTKAKFFSNYYFTGSVYGGAINIVTDLIINNKIVWIATDAGLIKFDITTGDHKLLLLGDDEPLTKKQACNKITQMLQDADGIIWLCTYEGLWSYNPSTNHFIKRISAANDTNYDPIVTTITSDSNKFWLGTWNKGLKLFDKASGAIVTYPYKNGNITSLSAVRKRDKKITIWLNGSLQAFDPITKTFFQYKNITGLPPDLNDVYTSSDGWLWLCTASGLYICNPEQQTFTNKAFRKDITSQGVVFTEGDQGFFIGAEGENILKKYNNHLNEVADYHKLIYKNYGGKHNVDALSIAIENVQSWWVGTNNGIVHISPQAYTSKWFYHNNKDSTGLPGTFITHLFIDRENILWIFPWRNGVWQMDKLTGKCRKMIYGLGKAGGVLKKLVISDVAEDNAGNLWMTDLDEGIILFERATNTFSKPFAQSIGGGPRTTRIYKQADNFYSLANTTIVKWKDKSKCITIQLPPEMQKYVYDFAPDQQGNWWFTTRNGLVYWDETKNIFKKFTTADGLQNNDIAATLFCKADGEMIAGGSNSITTFFPDRVIASSPVVPSITLTQLTANGSSIDGDELKTIQLPYTSTNISISWALHDYANPFKNQYYCKMQGSDSTWQYVGNRGEVQYAKLSPGDYTVLLKATSANGDAAPGNLKIHFIIHAPFWKTTLFYVLIALLIIGVLYFFISKRIKSIKAKAALQQQLGSLEMKALRAQMNPHFIFNSLNSIQECIVMNNTSAAYDYLSKFSKMVRRILENSSKLYVSLKEEMELLQWYVDLEQLRFKEPVKFTISADTTIDANNITVPSMILQPYVENALWHGLATKEGKKTLAINFIQKEYVIECTIEDNGIGRQASAAKHSVNYKNSMGMNITRQRLELFNKKARIEMNDLMDAQGNATGTRIVIYLPTE